MKLKEIATISGKPGLFRILKPTKNGVIVESLDEKKVRMAIGTSHRVSILKEVSLYTMNQDGATPLEEILHRIYQKYKEDSIPLDSKASNEELKDFIVEFVPDYDREKVYPSDMRKLVNWYGLLQKYSPETLETLLQKEEESNVEATTDTQEEVEAEAKNEVETVAETKEEPKKSPKKKAKEKEEVAEASPTEAKPKAEKPKSSKKKSE
jgi:Domain of unknown function (DUF5606)